MQLTTALNRASMALLLAAASACAGKKNDLRTTENASANSQPRVGTTDSASRDSAYGQQVMQGDMQLSDANILALVDFANSDEIDAGNIALKKATSEPVKSYARQVIKDHEQLQASSADIAKRIGVNPQMPTLNPLATPASNEQQLLQKTTAGPDFDRVYLEGEVRMHQQVVGLVRNAATQAKSAELKSMLVGALSQLEQHLTSAQKLQQQLTEVVMLSPRPNRSWVLANY